MDFNLRSFLFVCQTEVSSLCNARCIMCYPKIPFKRNLGQMMDLSLFKKLVDDLASYPVTDQVILERKSFISDIDCAEEEVSEDELAQIVNGKISLKLFGIGEPLLNPHFIEMLEYVKGKNFYVSFNTNASLLKRGLIKDVLATGAVDRICISVDSYRRSVYESIRVGLDFGVVMENLRILKEERKNYGKSVPKLEIVAVRLQENQDEIDEMAQYFGKLGFCVKFKDDVTINKGLPAGYLCNKINHSCFVCADGTVLKCCFDYTNDTCIGSLHKSSMKDIWLGEKNVRLMMNNSCRKLYDIPLCRQACLSSSL
ncbi:MAG: radical SAM/SPASM domain-containing protein [Candidatus Woesearchaeota archaeon]